MIQFVRIIDTKSKYFCNNNTGKIYEYDNIEIVEMTNEQYNNCYYFVSKLGLWCIYSRDYDDTRNNNVFILKIHHN